VEEQREPLPPPRSFCVERMFREPRLGEPIDR
jgi:hypothetical protein